MAPSCSPPMIQPATTSNQSGVGTCWHAQLTLPAGSGPNDIKMTWEETSGCIDCAGARRGQQTCTTGGGNKCTGNFENGVTIQRAYSARDSDTGFELRTDQDREGLQMRRRPDVRTGRSSVLPSRQHAHVRRLDRCRRHPEKCDECQRTARCTQGQVTDRPVTRLR